MPETLPLFSEPMNIFRDELREQLARLARHQIFVGTSSWKYEGWLGQIYSPERYTMRGRFSRRCFEQECLREYAETFSTVCGDFAFYQFPSTDFWKHLFEQSPSQLQFAFKIPEEITVPKYPAISRYGAKAGQKNTNFLNFDLLSSLFLEPLRAYQARVPLLIFEFGAVCGAISEAQQFLKQLYKLVSRLPRTFRYAVEVRNPELLRDLSYWSMLNEYHLSHVFNAWTKMPPLQNQLAVRQNVTTEFTVVRALLKSGRSYEEAVRLFSPYREVQEPNLDTRLAIREIIVECIRHGKPAFIYVNNRLEGNAPSTIHAILSELAESSVNFQS